MAAISGASHALKYKQQNPNASESEILQYISQDMDEILDKMDEELG
jgi:hypothetical protein